MKTLEYKGFLSHVQYSHADKIFFGKLEGINDLVTFEGKGISELKQAMKDAVEDYFSLCEKVGKVPNLRIG